MCFAPKRRALFDMSTSKSAPTLVCFVCFGLEMCFAPQRRALSRHLNFQKCSEAEVLCTFWLGNVLRATTACNFSSLIWPAGSAPAALASLLFDPPEPQTIGKTQWIATFYPFAHLHLLSSHSFSSLIFSLLLFSSLALPTSAFPSLHIVGSLTSKFPSIRDFLRVLLKQHCILLGSANFHSTTDHSHNLGASENGTVVVVWSHLQKLSLTSSKRVVLTVASPRLFTVLFLEPTAPMARSNAPVRVRGVPQSWISCGSACVDPSAKNINIATILASIVSYISVWFHVASRLLRGSFSVVRWKKN